MGATCPTDQVLEEHASGQHSDEIAEHARTCDDCAARLRRMQDTRPEPAASRAAAAPAYPPGTQIARFELAEKLGEGGMGVVYIARDPTLDRKVAIKLLHRADDSAESHARLLREAQAMAKLSHPSVVTVYEVGVHDGQVFLAMELVAGTTAKGWLAKAKRTWREIRDAFLEAGRGVAAAHAAGFVHRDFKPDNVLISDDGRVRVTDFGLARAVGSSGRAKTSDPVRPAHASLLASPITLEGSVVGTIAYMSPEQFAGGTVDPRSDIYSFCVTLYEALYGARPPREANELRDAPPADRDVPAWLHAALVRGLAIEPAERFQTMTELLAALADPVAAPPPRSRWPWLAGIGALALAGGAAAFAMRSSHRGHDDCELEPKLDGIWDDATKQTLADAFARVGGSDGVERWPYTERALDRYVGEWLSVGKAACEATRVQHEQSEAALQVRLECLDTDLVALRVLVQMLARPEPKLIDAAVIAVQQVSGPATCADPSILTVQPTPNVSRAERDALLERLERGVVHSRIGDGKLAVAELKALLADVQRTGAPELEAQVSLALANSEASTSHYADSLEHYRHTIDVAEQAHLDLVAAAAASGGLSAIAFSGRPLADVDAQIEPTLRVIKRAGDNARTRQQTAHALGNVYSATGRAERALPEFENSIRYAREALGPDTTVEILELNNLGAAQDDVGRYDDALASWREGLAVEKRLMGKNRDTSAITWINIALTTGKLGRLAESEDAAEHVLEIAKRVGDNDYAAMAMGLAAIARAAAGNQTEGAAWLAKAESTLAELKSEATFDGAEIMRLDTEAAVLLGQHAHARELADRLMANDTPRLPADSPQWVPNLRVAGMAYLADGQLAKARDTFERALALSGKQPFYAGWVGDMKYLLARALVGLHQDAPRAATLCREAETELAALPVRAKLHAEVAAWCAKPQ